MSPSPAPLFPIPNRSPIPSGMVALIGGITADRPIFGLYKDNREIYIHAPAANHIKEKIEEGDEFYHYKTLRENRKVYAYYLEIIQLQLPQIDFGRTKTGYLLHNARERRYYIIQRDAVPEYRFACSPWATFIQEDEIEVTVWGGLSDRRGIWKKNGKHVDIVYAWNPEELAHLDAAMCGYRASHGLDLTFEVYGHLIDRDGRIIGLVSEAAWGRMVEPTDKALIFAAIAKLQKRGCIYKGCLTNRFMIANDKVRLLELSRITWPYVNQAKLKEDAQTFHWDQLCQLFEELVQNGPYGNNRLPLIKFTANASTIIFLPYTCSPYLRISEVYSIRDVFAHTFGRLPGYEDRDDPQNPHSPSRSCASGRQLVHPLPRAPERRPPDSPWVLYPEDLIASLMRTLQGRHHRSEAQDHQLVLSHYPYRRRSRTQNNTARKALTNSDNTGSSIGILN